MVQGSSIVDVAGAAERLGVSSRWVRRAVAERRIPYFKVGRYVRFNVADLEQYLADNRVEPVVGLTDGRARS